MIKTSFAVGYRLNSETHVILGVTSIVPNLNGVLFNTEDRENHQVESHQMHECLGNMFIDYDQGDYDNFICTVHDHRAE